MLMVGGGPMPEVGVFGDSAELDEDLLIGQLVIIRVGIDEGQVVALDAAGFLCVVGLEVARVAPCGLRAPE